MVSIICQTVSTELAVCRLQNRAVVNKLCIHWLFSGSKNKQKIGVDGYAAVKKPRTGAKPAAK